MDSGFLARRVDCSGSRQPPHLGLELLDVVNLRGMFSIHEPAEGSIEAPMTVLAELQQKGLVRHIGLSNVTSCADCRSPSNRSHRLRTEPLQPRTPELTMHSSPILPAMASPMCRSFHSAGSPPLQSATLSNVAARLDATPMQVALAWLLQRSANILVIPGTSSVEHLRENLQSSLLQIPPEAIADLDAIS
jgi:pyridoxine 4-dehydrogenase